MKTTKPSAPRKSRPATKAMPVVATKASATVDKALARESAKAARKLFDANVIQHLVDDDEALKVSGLLTDTCLLPLRWSIPLNMSLVDRLLAMPVLPGASKSNSQGGMPKKDYMLSCKHDLGIWHVSDDPIRYLNDFPLHIQSARVEFPYFVLWALSRVLPEMYGSLIGSKFGPSTESTRSDVAVLAQPIPYDEHEPDFEFKYGAVMGRTSIHPTELLHTLITGATGAGKTYGGVKPLLQSFVAYHSATQKPMGILVIDPKSELLQICEMELQQAGQAERLFRLGSGKKLRFFNQKCSLGLENRYRTLANMVQVKTTGESSIWVERGNRLNIEMAELDRRFQLQTGKLLWGVVRSLIEGVDRTSCSQWDNIIVVLKHALISRPNVDWLASVSTTLLELCPGLHGLRSLFTPYVNDGEMLNQLYYRVSNAEQVCKDLSAREVVGVIDTDLYPEKSGNSVGFEALLSQGGVLVYQPSSSHFGDITGRLVKSRFFADVLARQDMRQPVGYVADECQRFISGDRDTGEQSFLDRSRAYRVNCVLASQSLSSIEHALIQTGERSPQLAVEIIVANSPTKIVYRSTDAATRRSLMEWIPQAPEGRRHVVEVRPPSQLGTGSAYYMCNGSWGIYHYAKLTPIQFSPRDQDQATPNQSLKEHHHGTV